MPFYDMERLVAEAEIARLMYAHCEGVDLGRFEETARLYADGTWYASPGQPLDGRGRGGPVPARERPPLRWRPRHAPTWSPTSASTSPTTGRRPAGTPTWSSSRPSPDPPPRDHLPGHLRGTSSPGTRAAGASPSAASTPTARATCPATCAGPGPPSRRRAEDVGRAGSAP